MNNTVTGTPNRPYTILCREGEDAQFGLFVHEADLMLGALGEEVYTDRMTPEEARECWLPYRHLYESLYDPVERGRDDPHQGFPYVFGDWDFMPGTQAFQNDVEQLGIPGVEMEPDMGRPVSFAVDMRVQGTEALARLSRILADQYRVILLRAGDSDGTTGLDDALECLQWARSQPAFHEPDDDPTN